MDAAELAKNGFYYTGKGDLCKCQFCNLEISHWNMGDRAKDEHKKRNAGCPFIKGRPVNNVNLGVELLQKNQERQRACEIRPFPSRAENDHRELILVFLLIWLSRSSYLFSHFVDVIIQVNLIFNTIFFIQKN
jgi:hypothetical protein